MNLELTDTVVKIMTLDVRKDFIIAFHQSILNVISSFVDSFKSTATRWKQILYETSPNNSDLWLSVKFVIFQYFQ